MQYRDCKQIIPAIQIVPYAISQVMCEQHEPHRGYLLVTLSMFQSQIYELRQAVSLSEFSPTSNPDDQLQQILE